jgi:hypothetical protein
MYVEMNCVSSSTTRVSIFDIYIWSSLMQSTILRTELLQMNLILGGTRSQESKMFEIFTHNSHLPLHQRISLSGRINGNHTFNFGLLGSGYSG